MNCREYQALLSEYLDGTLPEQEAQAVQAHLARCPVCQKEERVLSMLLNEVQAPLPEPKELFWINFLPRVRERIASRPEPWYAFFSKPAVAWGSCSLATLMVLAGFVFWRMAPVWKAAAPSVSPNDYLSYETGYILDEHLAQMVESSKDKIESKRKVFEKLTPPEDQSQITLVQQSDEGDLETLIEGLSTVQKKALDEKINEMKVKSQGQGGMT